MQRMAIEPRYFLPNERRWLYNSTTPSMNDYESDGDDIVSLDIGTKGHDSHRSFSISCPDTTRKCRSINRPHRVGESATAPQFLSMLI